MSPAERDFMVADPVPYFRKLRMLFCSELQLVSFLPELAGRARGKGLRQGLERELELCRERRDAIESLAARHGIAAAGDDCESMRRLIRECRISLGHSAWRITGDHDLRSISGSLHRLQILNYGVARSLANRLRLRDDVEDIDRHVDALLELYPDTFDLPVTLLQPAGTF